ncbi:MAG: cytochrome C biogenesis protein, partial [Thermoflavifilum sp.]|nr:cytochrome C biogenesis protein [Thermoflavifilum sp.]
MKKTFFLIAFLGMLNDAPLQAQLLNPVRWNFSTEKINDSTYALHFRASIDPGWHIYAQDAGEGPIPTSFHFQSLQGWKRVGAVQEHGEKIAHFDGAFGTVLKYFEHEVDFV